MMLIEFSYAQTSFGAIERVCKPVVDREYSEGYFDPGVP